MKKMRVADYFAHKVAATGSEAAFMVSGGMMMHLMDAIGRVPSVRYYCNHHEQASAMAADAYSRVSGRPGLCYATSGPGATNLLTGLVGAYQDSIPVIFFTGQVKLRDTMRASGISGLRQFGFLEVDIIPIVESVVKYAAFVDNPVQARFHIEKALHLCTSGRPGPVLLDVPLDIQAAMIDPEALHGYQALENPDNSDLDAINGLADDLLRAQRPLVLAGNGVRLSGSVNGFLRLVDRLGVPVVTTQIAKDLLPYNHSLFVGHPGVRGDRAANYAVQSADYILAVGTTLHNQTIGWEPELFAAYKVHVDPDPAVLLKTQPLVDRQLCLNVRQLIKTLHDSSIKQSHAHVAWRDTCQSWKRKFWSPSEPHKLGPDNEPANL